MDIMPHSQEKSTPKWHHPSDVMRLHKLKQKKKKLQARINGPLFQDTNTESNKLTLFEDVLSAKKRKNPFLKVSEAKRSKSEEACVLSESSDPTLFKLLNSCESDRTKVAYTSFNNILSVAEEPVEIVKAQGETWLPVDWTLKSKVRLLSKKPFPWNQKLKISEQASGVTAFTRCLDNNTETNLNTSPNAKFHQSCLYWQQPCLPWLNLFPRNTNKSQINSFTATTAMKDSLHHAWQNSLQSLFQLIRTRQCPYFYVCANNFTVLFRAAGICGFTDVHALISPTTRGFRQSLCQEEIEFSMPLKKRLSDRGYETLDSVQDEDEVEDVEEDWLKSLGVNEKDIKQINYTQEKIQQKVECEVDNSEQSLILIEGVQVLALYNFLINCKSATTLTGHLAGIPPTLLAPVAYHGASLNSLKVRESKVHLDDTDYYSLEVCGPILPSTIHNLFTMNPPEHSVTATFTDISVTRCFSKVKNRETKSDIEYKGTVVFGQKNLSDCGLLANVLTYFCTAENKRVTNFECVKYDSDSRTFTWS